MPAGDNKKSSIDYSPERNPAPRDRIVASRIILSCEHIERLKRLGHPIRAGQYDWSGLVTEVILRYLEEHPEI